MKNMTLVVILGSALSSGCGKGSGPATAPAEPTARPSPGEMRTNTNAAATADGVEQDRQGALAASTIESCAACHGDSGQGLRDRMAPPLAGMPEWYLNVQISKFIDGRRRPLPDRGGHGEQMVTLLKEIRKDELKRVTAYYSRMPPVHIQSDLGGDARKGQEIYWGKGACINCHLADGQGGERSGAPPITIIPEWYFMRQMKAFREGDRSAHTQEEIVQCMIVAASRLSDEECEDVASYLSALAKAKETDREIRPSRVTPGRYRSDPGHSHGGLEHKH